MRKTEDSQITEKAQERRGPQERGRGSPSAGKGGPARSRAGTGSDSGKRVFRRPSFVHSIGVFLLGVYLVSGYATDLSHRLFGEKPYLSMVSGVGLYVVVLFSGSILRGMGSRIGRYWLFFMGWMILATIFSTWRGGSLRFLWSYIPKVYFVFFLVCAFALTLRQCRALFYANIVKGLVLLIACLLEGRSDPLSGRFVIPGSWIAGNPNELAIELLMSSAFFLFLLSRRNVGIRLLAVGTIVTALTYVLKTGSRGGLLTLSLFFLGVFIFSKQRWKLAMVALPLAVVAFSVSGDLWRRMTLITVDPTDTSVAVSRQDLGSLSSQFARQELLKQSLWFMVTDPLLGVGPGQFMNAMWGEAVEEGEWVHPQGTHNAYTQVGSESGLPALYAFIATLLLSLRAAYRLYRETYNSRALAEVSGMALCLVGALLVYMGSGMFHHIAYSMYPGILAGLTVSLEAAARPLLEGRQSSPGTQTETLAA